MVGRLGELSYAQHVGYDLPQEVSVQLHFPQQLDTTLDSNFSLVSSSVTKSSGSDQFLTPFNTLVLGCSTPGPVLAQRTPGLQCRGPNSPGPPILALTVSEAWQLQASDYLS